jgi:flavin-dependent dehydrogenase
LLLRPRKWKDFVLGTNRIYLIGEAAGFVSPSSGEGISFALKSARRLAVAFQNSQMQISKKYKKSTRIMRIYLLLKNIKSFVVYTPFIRKVVMKLGIASISPFKK